MRVIDSFNRVIPFSTQDFLSDILRHSEEVVWANAIEASSAFINECLRQSTMERKKIFELREALESKTSEIEDQRLYIEGLRVARREDLKKAHLTRIVAVTGALSAVSLLLALVFFHRDTLGSMMSEPFSLLVITAGAAVSGIYGILTQRPPLSDPARQPSIGPILFGRRFREPRVSAKGSTYE